MREFLATALLVACALPGLAEAQGGTGAPARRLATIDTIRQFPGFFHLQNVLLRGEFSDSGARVILNADERSMDVLLADGASTLVGLVEVRAQVIDVGRLEPGDPRLARYDGARDAERWPRPGEELLLNVTGVTSVRPFTETSIRSLAIEPWRFDGQTVTVTGQFRGRNLFADLAGSPAKSNYDFVLRGAEGAVWVTGLRPRGKGFDLDVDARIDTNRWLKVTGIVKRERTLVTIAATRIEPVPPPAAQAAIEEPVVPAPPQRPVEVVFSSPTQEETEVAPTSPVRLQFSRGLDPSSLAGNIRAAYVGVPEKAIEFQTSYDAATRSIGLTFKLPLERFRTVTVETVVGLKGFDGALVTPWTLTFSVGE
ncbi:MAG: Ig-like domain-containing protein [Vicinamibacterales bacterium]